MERSASKILSIDELLKQRMLWKKNGEMVVFTNGCFDILHLGHVDYLEKSREKGDRLIVALNTDASVRKLKGEERPINNEEARARLMASLQFVDAVIYFSEQTPKEIIETLYPDILVKGDDYLAENIVGSDFVIARGGRVETIPLVKGFSTSSIIDKIKSLNN